MDSELGHQGKLPGGVLRGVGFKGGKKKQNQKQMFSSGAVETAPVFPLTEFRADTVPAALSSARPVDPSLGPLNPQSLQPEAPSSP